MEISGDAYFVKRPRTIADLRVAHPIEKRTAFSVSKKIVLSAIDYENFIYDLLVERNFIEKNEPLCFTGQVWNCLFVCKRASQEGILVVPESGGYVAWAAFYSL